MFEYIHQRQGYSVVTGFGDYRIVEELRHAAGCAEYLCLVADAAVGSACVGAGTLRFIHVRGRVLSWHVRAGADGFPVSELEPVRDDSEMEEVRRSLSGRYPSLQICF